MSVLPLGCVRMPFGFAEKLFEKTWIGMRVIISPDNAEPVEFSHPALLVPNREAIAAAPARAEALAREAAEAARTADEAKQATAKAPRETALLTASLRKLQGLKTRADAEFATADKALAAEQRDQLSHRVRRGAEQSAARRLRDAQAPGRYPRRERLAGKSLSFPPALSTIVPTTARSDDQTSISRRKYR